MNIIIGQRQTRGKRSDLVLTALGRFLKAREVDRGFSLCGEPDLYIQWGYRLTPALASAMKHGVPFAIVDLGLFGDRELAISVSFNGFQGLSMRPHNLPSKSRPHPDLLPWNLEGETIYVFGQLAHDRALRGIDAQAWASNAAREFSETTGVPAVVRPHPNMVGRYEPKLPPLRSLLGKCRMAVTWTSSAAIETARIGIPTITCHPANPANPVGCELNVDGEVVLPQETIRVRWMHELSHMNYSVTELDAAALYIMQQIPHARWAASQGEYDVDGLMP